MNSGRAPILLRFGLRLCLPPNERVLLLADLEEEYGSRIRPRRSPLCARLWYWREGLSLLFSCLGSRLRGEAPRDLTIVLESRRFRRHLKEHREPEETRGHLMENLWYDLRHALSSLRRQPKYTLAALLTLALGIGANTALFTVLNGVILQPLPYDDPGQLVKLDHREIGQENFTSYLTGLDFLDVRERATTLSEVACYYDYRLTGFDLTGGDTPRRIITMPISAGYFTVLGTEPILGRTFTRDEERYDTTDVIISHRLWQEYFAGESSALGSSIILDGDPRRVIGIMPHDFSEPFGRRVDVWMALNLVPGSPPPGFPHASNNSRDNYYLSSIGRLRSDVSLEENQAELDAIATAIDVEFSPDRDAWTVGAVPLSEKVIGGSDTMLWILFAAVGFVLLIACVNVANLTLARGNYMERELAIRSALGSSRGRLLRQRLTESLVLAALGALLGLLLAAGGIRFLLALCPDALPRVDEIGFNAAVFFFTAGLAVITGLLFGLVPALRSTRPDIERTLREVGHSTSAGIRQRYLRSALVVVQTALALLLLVGAALLVQSFNRLRAIDLGIEPANVLTFEISLPTSAYPVAEPARRLTFDSEFRSRLEALPGVVSAGAVSRLPAQGAYHSWGYVIRSEYEATGEAGWHLANVRIVAGDYFDVTGIDLVAGRSFQPADGSEAPPVLLISRSLADRNFTDGDPIGDQIWYNGIMREIVGIVEDVRIGYREEVIDHIYYPYEQWAGDRPWVMTWTVKYRGELPAVTEAVRAELADLDPALVFYNPRSLDNIVGSVIARDRFAMALMTIFAAVALLLAVTGIYGVLSYTVSQRQYELGIHLAIGARISQVRGLILREGMVLAGTGIALGLAASIVLTRWLASLVYEVDLTDPLILAGSAVVLGLVAWLASLLPARRAARTDPLTVMRTE